MRFNILKFTSSYIDNNTYTNWANTQNLIYFKYMEQLVKDYPDKVYTATFLELLLTNSKLLRCFTSVIQLDLVVARTVNSRAMYSC